MRVLETRLASLVAQTHGATGVFMSKMETKKLYVELARLCEAYSNCVRSNNQEWLVRHTERIQSLEQYLPNGSGFNSGTKLDIEASGAGKLVFTTSFHHMNDNGYYDGWTTHIVTVKPSLARDFKLSISGPNRNGIKDYMHEVFSSCLDDEDWSIRDEYLRQVENSPAIKIESRWLDQCTQVWQSLGRDFKSYIEAMRHSLQSLQSQ